MNGEKVPSNWVYGGICFGKGAFSIIYDYMDEEKEKPIEKHVVYTDTVGQYTGLTDKKGNKIFEGDIVNIEYLETTVKNAVIEYVGASFYGTTEFDSWEINDYCWLEVIGNIHDNPELLKGE
jgi:uncharacterized phage protein (TIGR01671 family)